MFRYLRKKIFGNGTSSSETKRVEQDEKNMIDSNTTSSITQLSTQIDCKFENSGPIHLEPEPRPVSQKEHSTSQLLENEGIVDSNQVDGIQRTQQVQEMPEIIRSNPDFERYWNNRYKLFSKYDEGIKLDTECWYSVTPEEIGAYIARRCKCDVVVDAFCGAGGNAIQFALTCKRVITTDIDPEKIKLAKHNANIYGVADRIEFIHGDFFEIAPSLTADVVFLSPPWGGPSYINFQEYQLSQIMERYGGEHVYTAARQITKNIIYFLPKNINIQQVNSIDSINKYFERTKLTSLEPDSYVKIERTYLDNSLFAITAYYGDLAKDYCDEDERTN